MVLPEESGITGVRGKLNAGITSVTAGAKIKLIYYSCGIKKGGSLTKRAKNDRNHRRVYHLLI
jgi:hypothetical protein